MTVFTKSLQDVLSGLNADYSFISLITALIFIIADAAGIFICLRRAEPETRWVSFLAPMSVYAVLTAVVLGNLQKFVNVFLKIKIGIPDSCGFIAAAVCGILCMGFSLLICSGSVTRNGGRIALCLSTVIAAAAEAVILFRVYLTADGHADADLSAGPVLRLSGILENVHTDYIAVVVAVLFFIAAFLCFIANKDKAGIAEGEKIIRASALVRQYGYTGDDAGERFCCRYCQYASSLRFRPDCMLCSARGVTDADHICGEFIYDPLKKIPEPADISEFTVPDGQPDVTAEHEKKADGPSRAAAMMETIRKHGKQ